MGVNSLPKSVTRYCRGCDLNPGPSARESSTLTTRLPSHPTQYATKCSNKCREGPSLLFRFRGDKEAGSGWMRVR